MQERPKQNVLSFPQEWTLQEYLAAIVELSEDAIIGKDLHGTIRNVQSLKPPHPIRIIYTDQSGSIAGPWGSESGLTEFYGSEVRHEKCGAPVDLRDNLERSRVRRVPLLQLIRSLVPTLAEANLSNLDYCKMAEIAAEVMCPPAIRLVRPN
jgi:hypothetical protein